MPKEQKPRSHPEPTVSPQKGKSKKKTSSSSKDESFMQFYPSTTHRVSEKIKAKIRANPLLMASWKARYEYCNNRARAENSRDWPIKVPREIMDQIMGDPVLGLHALLYAGAITTTTSGTTYAGIPPDSKRMLHLATSPQKKKAHGPYFKELADAYGSHRYSIKNCWEHVRDLGSVLDVL
uniref:Uncharacterized protein n=1 Tax=Moniliophthora roreri TaxID=221103 RepID=A0A0W0FTK5_MONRR